MPDDLLDDHHRCLQAITTAELAWVPERDLDAETVAVLAAAGYVERWDDPNVGGPFVTLTPWGADRVDRVIREHAELHTSPDGERCWVDVPRWSAPGESQPAPRVPRFGRQVGLPHPSLVIDQGDGPEQQAILAEEAGRARGKTMEQVCNEWGEPVTLFGVPLLRERPGAKPAARPKRPGSEAFAKIDQLHAARRARKTGIA